MYMYGCRLMARSLLDHQTVITTTTTEHDNNYYIYCRFQVHMQLHYNVQLVKQMIFPKVAPDNTLTTKLIIMSVFESKPFLMVIKSEI